MNVSELMGKLIRKIEVVYNDEIHFYMEDGTHYKMYSDENGCGNAVSVTVDDICGDLAYLINSPILMAEEVTSKGDSEYSSWTYYKFATRKGYVTIAWYGESNGYYRTAAVFEKIEAEDEEGEKYERRYRIRHNLIENFGGFKITDEMEKEEELKNIKIYES